MSNVRPLGPDLSLDDVTVIANDNFRRLDNYDSIIANRITKLENPTYYNGDIGTELTADTYKSLGGIREQISGITKTNSTTLTVSIKGVYFISIQQLISAGANAGYFTIRINNSDVVYGYYTASSMNDVPASLTKELSVGDTIRVYQSHAITSCWSGAHSNINVHLLKRTI